MLTSLLLMVVAAHETKGVVSIEAERFTGKTGAWQTVAGKSGKAMMIAEGGWTDHLVYDIEFKKPGVYKVWLLGRSGGHGGSNEVKVFFDEKPDAKGNYYEMKFENDFGWVGKMSHKTPANRKTPGLPTVKVDKPGVHRLYLVKGAEPECHTPPCASNFANWQVDKIVLTLADAPPEGVGPAETVKPSATK